MRNFQDTKFDVVAATENQSSGNSILLNVEGKVLMLGTIDGTTIFGKRLGDYNVVKNPSELVDAIVNFFLSVEDHGTPLTPEEMEVRFEKVENENKKSVSS